MVLKNVKFALRAFIKANLDNTIFVIVGDGPEKVKLAFYSMKPLKMPLEVKGNMMISSFEENIKKLYSCISNS